MVTSSPEKFAEWFNDKYPGVYRKVVTDDVKDMRTVDYSIVTDIMLD